MMGCATNEVLRYAETNRQHVVVQAYIVLSTTHPQLHQLSQVRKKMFIRTTRHTDDGRRLKQVRSTHKPWLSCTSDQHYDPAQLYATKGNKLTIPTRTRGSSPITGTYLHHAVPRGWGVDHPLYGVTDSMVTGSLELGFRFVLGISSYRNTYTSVHAGKWLTGTGLVHSTCTNELNPKAS